MSILLRDTYFDKKKKHSLVSFSKKRTFYVAKTLTLLFC